MKIIILVIGVFILASWKIIKLIKQELKIKYLNTDKYKCRSGIYLVTKNYDKKYITVNNLTTMYYSVLSRRVDNHLENLIKYFIYNKSELEPTSMNALFRAANIADVPLFSVGKSEEIRDRVTKYIDILYKTFELCTICGEIVGYNYLIRHIYLKNTIMKVYCFSYLEFKKLVNDFNWYTESHIDNNAAIISITNPKSDNEKLNDWTTEHLVENHKLTDLNKVLNLSFHDDSEDFDPGTAKLIIDFIEINKGKDFYVHCIMGKSRSQAICRFILDNFEGYVEGRPYENPIKTPNYHVLSTLNRVFKYTA
jgi:predicted protein tyrosine phosphatase